MLEALRGAGVEWMRSMFIDDIVASHSDNVLDIPTLALTLKSNEAYNTNVAVQVLPYIDTERRRAFRKNAVHMITYLKIGSETDKPTAPSLASPHTSPPLSRCWCRECAGCSGPGRELCEEGRQRHSAC